ncbi:ABC transporter permease [Denitratimonas sp. CY0512]|uniref:ABC transporter permease n=1 Tax=Denitratimonas sp. CY0512 TaxID=3131940 RepID=UPI0030A8F6DB
MNASTSSLSPARKFGWLLRREFWENRGGFFWAPVIAGIVICALSLLGALAGSLHLSGIDKPENLNAAMSSDEFARQMGFIGDGGLLAGVGIVVLVLGFVVFFYCLGALYDDRRDRSILFWKSLPVSDWLTVLSKLAWALLLAPVLAIGIGLAIGACLLLISALTMAINGMDGSWAMIWHSHPIRVTFNALSIVPVYAAWSLPTVGWLMLCSAFARSKPFLWAVLVPVLSATLLSWMGALPGISMPHGSIWYTLVYRGLLSIAPGTWYIDSTLVGRLAASAQHIENPSDLMRVIDLSRGWHIFAGADVWIGMAAGTAMIALAIWLRRRRDDA